MSDRVHRKQRPLLPEGYQYGDAGCQPIDVKTHAWTCALPYGYCNCGVDTKGELKPAKPMPLVLLGDEIVVITPQGVRFPSREKAMGWRAPHENAAAQLTRSHVHDFRARYDEGIYFAICVGCGLNAGPVDCSRMETLCGIGIPSQRTGEETI